MIGKEMQIFVCGNYKLIPSLIEAHRIENSDSSYFYRMKIRILERKTFEDEKG